MECIRILGIKVDYKMLPKNFLSLAFRVEIDSSISIKGREFRSLGMRLKY